MNELGLGMVFSAKDLASGVMQRVGKGMLDVEGRSSATGLAIQKNFQAFSTGLATVGVGASLLAGGFGLASISGQFNEQVASVGAVANASAEELAALHDAAIDAGVATQFSPTEAVVGLGDLAQAGYNAQESISLLRPVLDLAAGSLGKLSPSGAAGLASQTMKAFKIPIQEAGITMDKLLQSVNAFALSAEELPLALGTAARGAGVMNQSLDETLIALGLVKNVVPGVERASTSVAVAMERMVNPETAQALKAQGVAVADAQGRFRPFLDVIRDLIPAMNKMGTEQKRAAFLSKTFGTEALGGIQAILGQITNGIKDNTGAIVTGSKAIDFLRDSFKGAEGTAASFANKMLDTFEGQKKLMRGSIETLAIVLGEPFERALKPVVALALGLLNQVLGFVKNMPAGMKDFLAKLVLGVGTVLTLVGGLIAAKAAIAMFVLGMKAIGVTVGGVIATLAPALLIIGALIGAAYAFKYAVDNNIGGIGGKFFYLVQVVSLAVEAISQLFSDGGFSGDVLKAFGDESTKPIFDFAIRVYVIANRILEFFSKIGTGISQSLEGMGPTFERLSTAVTALGRSFGFLSAATDVGGNTDELKRWGDAGLAAGKAIGSAIDTIVNAISAGIEFVTGFADNFKLIGDAGKEMKPAFVEISAAIVQMGEVFEGSGSKAATGVSGWRQFGRDIAAIVSFVISLVSTVVNELGSQFKFLSTMFTGLSNILGGVFSLSWSRIWLGIKQVAASALSSILSLLGMVVEQMAKVIDFFGSVFGEKFGLTKRVQDIRNAIKEALTVDKPPAPGGGQAPGAVPGETMPQELIDFYTLPPAPQGTDLPFAPTIENVAAAQAEARQAVDVESLNAAIASMKAAKEGMTVLDATMTVDAEVLGRISAKAQAGAKAGGGGVTPVQVY